jgi:hypothetical protein
MGDRQLAIIWVLCAIAAAIVAYKRAAVGWHGFY